MQKQNRILTVKKINKKKAPLPAGKLQKLKHLLNHYKVLGRLAVLFLALLATGSFNHFHPELGYWFKASIIEAPQSFTGTTYPVEKVPNWTTWGGENQTTAFSEVDPGDLIPFPAYDLSKLQFPNDGLVWGNSAQDEIRNAKITYSVVYLGNYQSDHQEGVGSHLAVDLRMPKGTPIVSIANGQVVKVSMTEYGFGHHVVIKHHNVPDPDNPNKTTNLYSGYNHMDQIHVTEGQLVKKGEQIGTSGDTGTATTPHLHFQIDRDSAPWHPYWPFSGDEAAAAGLSFFEAVNAALGIENAKSHTINPMPYVEKYLDSTDLPAVSTPAIPPAPDPQLPDKNHEETASPTPPLIDSGVESNDNNLPSGNDGLHPAADTSLFNFELKAETVGMVGSGLVVKATLNESDFGKMTDEDRIQIKVTGVGRLSKDSFKKVDFKERTIQFIVNSSEAGTTTIEVGKSVHQIEFISDLKPISKLKIQTDGYFQKGQREIIKLVALSQDEQPTPIVNFGGTLKITAKEGVASFKPDQLSINDFKNGIAEIEMTVTGEDRVIVRAQDGAIVGESEPIFSEPLQLFSDIPKNHPHYEAIKFLATEGVINGYSDRTFKADQFVNRVEALKMLMLAFNVDEGSASELPFTDTDRNAWYAKTLATAYEREIVQGYADKSFKPERVVNTAEFLKMIFQTNGIEPATDLAGNPYDDVPQGEWYAGYAYLTNKKNLLDTQNNQLGGSNGMTRGKVAEMIYRMRYVADNGLVTYAK